MTPFSWSLIFSSHLVISAESPHHQHYCTVGELIFIWSKAEHGTTSKLNVIHIMLANIWNPLHGNCHLSRCVSVGSADQGTPPDTQPVTQQLCHSSGPQHPRQVLWLLQVEDATSRASRSSTLQDYRGWGPGPGVKASHQPLRLPNDVTLKSGGHAVEPGGRGS